MTNSGSLVVVDVSSAAAATGSSPPLAVVDGSSGAAGSVAAVVVDGVVSSGRDDDVEALAAVVDVVGSAGTIVVGAVDVVVVAGSSPGAAATPPARTGTANRAAPIVTSAAASRVMSRSALVHRARAVAPRSPLPKRDLCTSQKLPRISRSRGDDSGLRGRRTRPTVGNALHPADITGSGETELQQRSRRRCCVRGCGSPGIVGVVSGGLTTIDVLMLLDGAALDVVRVLNARMVESVPTGFAFDGRHTPHITVLQRFVHTKRLGEVYDAVGATLAGVGSRRSISPPSGCPRRGSVDARRRHCGSLDDRRPGGRRSADHADRGDSAVDGCRRRRGHVRHERTGARDRRRVGRVRRTIRTRPQWRDFAAHATVGMATVDDLNGSRPNRSSRSLPSGVVRDLPPRQPRHGPDPAAPRAVQLTSCSTARSTPPSCRSEVVRGRPSGGSP